MFESAVSKVSLLGGGIDFMSEMLDPIFLHLISVRCLPSAGFANFHFLGIFAPGDIPQIKICLPRAGCANIHLFKAGARFATRKRFTSHV